MELRAHNRELPLADLLQVLHQNRRTCLVRVASAAQRGELHLVEGELVHATLGALHGLSAAHTLLARSEISYEVVAARGPVERTIHASMAMLLLESARLVDEAQRSSPLRTTEPISLPATRAAATPRRSLSVVAGALALLLVGAGVAVWSMRGDAGPVRAVAARPTAGRSPTSRPSAPAQSIVVKGSDTIGSALGPAWAQAFSRTEPAYRVDVEALGTATGFAGLLDGTADLAMASRVVRPDERALADTLGVELRELVAGYDGIAVVVHPSNRLTKLDLRQVADLFSGKVTRWSELGGIEAPVRVLGRPSYSGTHTFFAERVLGARRFRADIEEFESSDALVDQVANDPFAIAYVGAGHAGGVVRALKLAERPAGPFVAPSDDNVRGGSYPLSRALMLYVRDDASEPARAFARFAVSPAGQALVGSFGFVPAGPTVEARTQALLAKPGRGHAPVRVMRLFFDTGSASLPGEARATLASVAESLRAAAQLVVVGNADRVGVDAQNERVSLARAESVVAALRELGVPEARLTVQSAGASRPLSSNDSGSGRKDNRRVDLFIVAREP